MAGVRQTPLRKWLSQCFLDPHSCPTPSSLRGLLSPCLAKGNQGIDRFLAGLVPQPVLTELGCKSGSWVLRGAWPAGRPLSHPSVSRTGAAHGNLAAWPGCHRKGRGRASGLSTTEIIRSPPPAVKPVNFFKPHLLSYCLFSGRSSNFRYPPQIWCGSPVIPERSAIHLKFHHSSHKQANTVSFAQPLWPETQPVVCFLAWELTAGRPTPASPLLADFHLEVILGAGSQPGPSPASLRMELSNYLSHPGCFHT